MMLVEKRREEKRREEKRGEERREERRGEIREVWRKDESRGKRKAR
jgi:hypothetical protein